MLVIAGDARSRISERGLPWLHETFTHFGLPIVYCPGNHDFYKTEYGSEVIAARRAAERLGIHLLVEGECVELGGARFVGGTLWTDYEVAGNRQLSQLDALHRMNDHKAIRMGPSYRRWNPSDAAAVHERTRAAIEYTLATESDLPTIVVTHHAPVPESLKDGVVKKPLDAAYASDLTELIEARAPEAWIHGHVHMSRHYAVGTTQVIANPRGYVSEYKTGRAVRLDVENPNFDLHFTIPIEKVPICRPR